MDKETDNYKYVEGKKATKYPFFSPAEIEI